MIRGLHKKLFKDKSPFALCCATAIVMGIGDVVNNLTDWYWLIGDMSIHTHVHHYHTMAGLAISLFLMVVSYYWLYLAIGKFLTKKMHKKINSKAKAKRSSVK